MDPVDALNRVFPDAESYAERAQAAQDYAQACAARLEQQLRHRPDVAPLRARAQHAPEDFRRLTAQAQEIRRTGNATLANVRAVTSGIKRLDVAKDNLTSTIRMLRQLKMLTNLYIQLDSLLRERRYEDMTGAVGAASDLIDYFRPFRPLPQISQISQEIGEMETKIYGQVEEDFRAALAAPGDPTSASSAALLAACTVLDSLDSASGKATAQTRLVQFYCDRMLAEYARIFAPTDEAGSLENVKRRFTYLKNKVLLVYLSSHHKFFPESWRVRDRLVAQACDRTAADLVGQLRTLGSGHPEQIQLLLATLQDCDDFERFAKCEGRLTGPITPFLSLWVEFQDRQLAQRISTYAKLLVPPDEGDDVLPSSKELVNFYRALLAQLAKLRHHQGTLRQLAAVMADHLGNYASQVLLAYLPHSVIRSADEVRVVGLVDTTAEYIISTTHQLERNIAAQIDSAIARDALRHRSRNLPLAGGSRAGEIGESRGESRVETRGENGEETRGETRGENRGAIREQKRGAEGPEDDGAEIARDDTDSSRRAADDATGESTADKIDAIFEQALSKYRLVGIRAEDLFVAYVQRSIEPVWVELATKFAAHRGGFRTDVSRVSPYTQHIIDHINPLLAAIFRAAPRPAMVFNVGSRTAEVVCVGYLTMAMARTPKPIGESLAEQLLLDFGAIKSQTLLKIGELAPPETAEKRGAARLDRLVPRIIEIANQAEAVLKLLMTPSEPMDTFVMNYQILIKDRSTLNFRKILEVKGIRFQNEAIGKFKLMASQEPHLIPENLMLKQIPTVPPPLPSGFSSAFESSSFGFSPSPSHSGRHSPSPSGSGFNMNQFKKLGGLLRRDN